MKNSVFIKRYGIRNFKSIIDAVKDNLVVLHYNKEIPKYKINKKNKLSFIQMGNLLRLI